MMDEINFESNKELIFGESMEILYHLVNDIEIQG